MELGMNKQIDSKNILIEFMSIVGSGLVLATSNDKTGLYWIVARDISFAIFWGMLLIIALSILFGIYKGVINENNKRQSSKEELKKILKNKR